MGRTSPVVAQFEFAARVRKRREELGLSAAVVSKHLGFTRNFYSAVENSRSLLATAKLPLLIEALQFDDADAQTLTTLLEQARTPGWWQPYLSLLDEAIVQTIGLEYGASKVRSCENLIFYGIVQCPNYALHVMQSSPNLSSVAMQRFLEFRLRRQEEFFRNYVPELTLLMGETLLWQEFGGRSVLKEQLEHLLALSERLGSSLQFRIRPFASSPSGLQSISTMTILNFSSPFVSSVVCRDAGVTLVPSSDPGLVEYFQVNWDHALASVYTHAESVRMIKSRIDQLADTEGEGR